MRSGCVLSFFRSDAADATPAVEAAPRRVVPSRRRVDDQLCTTECCQSVCHNLESPTVHDVERRKVHVTHEDVRGGAGPCFSAHQRPFPVGNLSDPTLLPRSTLRHGQGGESLRRLRSRTRKSGPSILLARWCGARSLLQKQVGHVATSEGFSLGICHPWPDMLVQKHCLQTS